MAGLAGELRLVGRGVGLRLAGLAGGRVEVCCGVGVGSKG